MVSTGSVGRFGRQMPSCWSLVKNEGANVLARAFGLRGCQPSKDGVVPSHHASNLQKACPSSVVFGRLVRPQRGKRAIAIIAT